MHSTQAPLKQRGVSPPHVCVMVATWSAPHASTLAPLQNVVEESFPEHSEAAGWQEPALTPRVVSHTSLPLQVPFAVHFPSEQISCCLEACPWQASAPSSVQGWLSVPMALASAAPPAPLEAIVPPLEVVPPALRGPPPLPSTPPAPTITPRPPAPPSPGSFAPACGEPPEGIVVAPPVPFVPPEVPPSRLAPALSG